jgi:murein DD-endopeptidase MepM/ murein hydrolase activator NlpD
MGTTACPRRTRVALVAASLWMSVALSCAHVEEAPAPVAKAAGPPEPAGPAEPSPKPEPAEPTPKPEPAASCGDATGAKPFPFRWPARGAITSAFGMRGGDPHEGIDISARSGLPVRAAAAGTVIFSDYKPGYGRVIFLKHAGGYKTVYAHNQDNLVLEGARVEQGEVIADMGSTGEASGPHLHFEIRVGDRPVNPLDCLPVRAKGR